MTTIRHGVAAFDFASVSGIAIYQLLAQPMHVLELLTYVLMTDVPDLVRVLFCYP